MANKKRKPFKTLQTTAPVEKQSSMESSDEAAGVLDKIEQLIGEGRYRVGGAPRTPKSNAQKTLGGSSCVALGLFAVMFANSVFSFQERIKRRIQHVTLKR